MLLISRNQEQRLTITHAGETLTVLVAETRGNAVRLGFEGNRSFAIVRDDAKCTTRSDADEFLAMAARGHAKAEGKK